MKYLPLKTKYIGGICGLMLFVSLVLLLFLRLQLHDQLEIELQKRGASITRNLADASVKPILTENYVALQLLVNDLKKHEEDISYIYIISKQGQIIAHTFGQTFPRDLLKLDHPDMNIEKLLVQKLLIEQDELDDVSAVIQQGNFGRVHVGLSEESLKIRQRDVLLYIAPFIGLILMMGVTGGWWFASKITKPIIELSNNAKKVAGGQLNGFITVKSQDELGELTAAFNAMTADLKKRTELQQRTEDELRMQTSLLENEVAERQMAQEELSVKQTQLEALNLSLEERINHALIELRMKDRVMFAQGRQAAIGEMINNIAHQWRQPLNNLGLIVQNIKADYDSNALTPAALTDAVNKVMSTIIFMSQTINDFSNFFSQDKVKSVFHIYQGLTKVIAMIEASLLKQGIKLTVEQVEGDVAVAGYFNEYNQVLLNLLNNARDALLDRRVDKPVITVRILNKEGQGVVQVTDNAGGIPENIIGQIFDPYFTTKEHGKGSGVGLYMSKTIIQEHFDGNLTAANVDGGAQFTIITPYARKEL